MALLDKIINIVVNPAIRVLLAVAIFYFVWGVWKFVRNSESAEGRQEGARHIGFSLIGLFVMVSVFGIMWLIQNSFNLH